MTSLSFFNSCLHSDDLNLIADDGSTVRDAVDNSCLKADDSSTVRDAVGNSCLKADGGSTVRDAVAFCQTSHFKSFIASFGLRSGLSFEANPRLVGDDGSSSFQQRYNKFLSACRGLPDTSQVAVVFHGTREGNIPNILENGLDPNRRKHQSYGPGEYFAKNPTVPLSYCRGGNQMLVFLVVVPGTQSGTVFGEKIYFKKPKDYVIVETNAHQLPLGVLSFGEVDQQAMERSKKLKKWLKALSATLDTGNERLGRSKAKADFIQMLIRTNKVNYFEQMEKASQIYKKNKPIWLHAELREISMYVHKRGIDVEMIPYYFPDLPDPMTGMERDECSEIYSIEETQRWVARVQRKIAKTRSSYSDFPWDVDSFAWQQFVTGLATPNQK